MSQDPRLQVYDDLINGIKQLEQERDELRAQVAALKYGIERAYGSNHNRVYAVLYDLRKEHRTTIAAQYVQGLEAALQMYARLDNGRGDLAQQALAAKEEQA